MVADRSIELSIDVLHDRLNISSVSGSGVFMVLKGRRSRAHGLAWGTRHDVVSVLRSQVRDRKNTEDDYSRGNSNWLGSIIGKRRPSGWEPKWPNLRCLSQQKGIHGRQKYDTIASIRFD